MCTCFAGRTRAPSEPRLYRANFVPMIYSVINTNDAFGSLKLGVVICELAACKTLGMKLQAGKHGAPASGPHESIQAERKRIWNQISRAPLRRDRRDCVRALHELTCSSSGCPGASAAPAPARPGRPRRAPAFRAGAFCTARERQYQQGSLRSRASRPGTP